MIQQNRKDVPRWSVFNKITNGNKKGRKLAESEEDKKQMLNNIKTNGWLRFTGRKKNIRDRQKRQMKMLAMI